MNPHRYWSKGRDFVQQGKIENDVNERAVFIRRKAAFSFTPTPIISLTNCKNSFTGTVISDGKGRVYVEWIEDTVDNRKLTSCGADTNKCNRAYFFADEERIYFSNNKKLDILLDINNLCKMNKGYFEFAYGILEAKRGIWFTYYSDNKLYCNLLENDIIDFAGELRCRLEFRALGYYNIY